MDDPVVFLLINGISHNKTECTNPEVPREFTGTCRVCEKQGHRAAECPDASPPICKNCAEEGMPIVDSLCLSRTCFLILYVSFWI